MEIFAGFLIGLTGSLHCIGMCGPIALALPKNSNSNSELIIGRILYNLGRTLTYAMFGVVFGLLGTGIKIFGFQQVSSIFFGVSILIYLFLPINYKTKIASLFSNLFGNFIKEKLKKLFQSSSNTSLFFIGVVNGFLPCGFVYIGIAGAIAVGSVLNSALFMFMFGLGTIPAMFIFSLVPSFTKKNFQISVRKILPIFSFIVALLFILRGLNLGIPLISPKFSTEINHEIIQDTNGTNHQHKIESTEINCCP